ncbi:MAG: tRNA (adenosine(37)-N6)-threonylcarbamoyltransferase complex dimerization subunit type 1 TsaB [Nitrospinae bacterium]|nr:tRNA (adenosine(37)-N6)-threonylcarbamoyltransferase complex dimerization subunit type 1 TsaB [Nitrospinota bacterium]
MRILGVDTSSRLGSVAIVDGETVVGEISSDAAASFSRQMLGMIETLLARHGMALNELDAIAVAAGPGSFTGIRIGLATAEGISLAAGVPVAGVSSLEAAASAARTRGRIAAALDAGGGKVYHALFDAGGDGLTRITPDTFSPRAAIAHETGPRVGDGWPDTAALNVSVAAGAALRAGELLAAGAAMETLRAVPNYVQQSAAEKNLNFLPEG